MRNALAFLAVVCVASMAFGQIGDFDVSKDNGADMNAPDGNAGVAGQVRGAKNPWMEDTSWYGFDKEEIAAWIAANGGNAAVVKVEFCIRPSSLWGRDAADPDNVGIHVYGLKLAFDWDEGDGNNMWGTFNWTEGTGASTYNHSSAVYTTAGGTAPPAHVGSVPWTDAGGTPRNNVADPNLWPIRNANDFISPADRDGWAANPYDICVELDPAFWMDLIYEGDNRGIILWDLENLPHPDENWQVYMKDQDNQPNPHLLVHIPEPASMLLIAVGGVGALLRRRR